MESLKKKPEAKPKRDRKPPRLESGASMRPGPWIVDAIKELDHLACVAAARNNTHKLMLILEAAAVLGAIIPAWGTPRTRVPVRIEEGSSGERRFQPRIDLGTRLSATNWPIPPRPALPEPEEPKPAPRMHWREHDAAEKARYRKAVALAPHLRSDQAFAEATAVDRSTTDSGVNQAYEVWRVSGTEAAYDDLLRASLGFVQRSMEKKGESTADEIAGETGTRLYRMLPGYAGPNALAPFDPRRSSFSTFVVRVAEGVRLDLWRRRNGVKATTPVETEDGKVILVPMIQAVPDDALEFAANRQSDPWASRGRRRTPKVNIIE